MTLPDAFSGVVTEDVGGGKWSLISNSVAAELVAEIVVVTEWTGSEIYTLSMVRVNMVVETLGIPSHPDI